MASKVSSTVLAYKDFCSLLRPTHSLYPFLRVGTRFTAVTGLTLLEGFQRRNSGLGGKETSKSREEGLVVSLAGRMHEQCGLVLTLAILVM